MSRALENTRHLVLQHIIVQSRSPLKRQQQGRRPAWSPLEEISTCGADGIGVCCPPSGSNRLLLLPRSGPYTQTRPLKFAYNFARISCNKCHKPTLLQQPMHAGPSTFLRNFIFVQLIKASLQHKSLTTNKIIQRTLCVNVLL